nr:MAG TPA: hypothetical protein [Caudoviricetes sp.]
MKKISLEPIYFVNENEMCKKHLTVIRRILK